MTTTTMKVMALLATVATMPAAMVDMRHLIKFGKGHRDVAICHNVVVDPEREKACMKDVVVEGLRAFQTDCMHKKG
jgi:hypothetical protein